MDKVDVLIVGGGLAGLSLGRLLTQTKNRPISYRIVEARQRVGGRIESRVVETGQGAVAFDMGPTWFWQGQPRMRRLIEQLGLASFDQYAAGDLLYQDERGNVHRGRGHASMEGSLRVVGGVSSLTNALGALVQEHLSLGCRVTQIVDTGSKLETEIVNSSGSVEVIECDCVVLAMPPRLVGDTIRFEPGLPTEATMTLRTVPTWMAGHAKAIAVYDQPFWREAGLSGDAMSRIGPLAEIHDASPAEGGPYALFGFVGVPAHARREHQERMPAVIQEQLARLFGDEAKQPRDFAIKDWAFEPETATDLDQAPAAHPGGMPSELQALCGGRLILGSTEVAATFGGYLEGALEAAEAAADQVRERFARNSKS